MDRLFKIVLLCLAIYAITGCNKGEKPKTAPRLEEPLEIKGYKLGMSERAMLAHGTVSCQNAQGRFDADRICSVSTDVLEQPALMYFYFYNDSLEKLTLTILPRKGQLSEVSKLFSESFETKYGKPSTDGVSTAVWSHKGEAISINRGDERTMTINLMSDTYENEKARREKNANRGVEI